MAFDPMFEPHAENAGLSLIKRGGWPKSDVNCVTNSPALMRAVHCDDRAGCAAECRPPRLARNPVHNLTKLSSEQQLLYKSSAVC